MPSTSKQGQSEVLYGPGHSDTFILPSFFSIYNLEIDA